MSDGRGAGLGGFGEAGSQYGSTTDNNEPISITPYGIVFGISRTMLVNDDLGAIVRDITPTLTTSVNPFSGRLRSVSDANITDSSWYLMAEPARVPTFIYGFLAGSGGPRTCIYEPFGIQGIKVSLEHDFGCGAIDYRGAWRNAGQ